jgi:hypothetical protein
VRGSGRRGSLAPTLRLVLSNDRCDCISRKSVVHHQPINVLTAGEQAFLMDYQQGECAITHHTGTDWWVLTTANAAGTNSLTFLLKHGGARDNKFLVTHLMSEQRCLTSAIARRSALTVGPSNSSSKSVIESMFF